MKEVELVNKRSLRFAALTATLSMGFDACGGAAKEAATTTKPLPPATNAPVATAADAPVAVDPATICDADSLVAAMNDGPADGTLAGMADAPVATAASSNPVLTTLDAAVTAAGLVDTLNSAEALTVFAPTDCAFAALDPATLQAALADPSGLLMTVLGFHVIPQRLSAKDLAGKTELTTFGGATLQITVNGGKVTLNNGGATVVVPDIQTANATVHLIDVVMLPPAAPATTEAPLSTEGSLTTEAPVSTDPPRPSTPPVTPAPRPPTTPAPRQPVTTDPAPRTTDPAPLTTDPAPRTTDPAPLTTDPAPLTT
jgi:uncharacterized surface protein with fasciclin (FAS1) repeats